ncbi:MAG: hypothetical protein RLZZ387_2671 [Chloroflexota bacterium]
MELTRTQLEAIAGERLKEHRVHGGGRYTLGLPGGDRRCLLTFDTPDEARTAAAALSLLRAEVDLPLPQVRASNPGAGAGVAWVLASDLPGEPLETVAQRIPDEQLYKLGRRLGEVMHRVHRVACDRYGALAGDDPLAADDERGYVLGRLAAALQGVVADELLRPEEADAVRAWFDAEFIPVGGRAALVCGGLTPATILVRQSGGSWTLSGVTQWGGALGWSPLWDHALLLDAAGASRYFSLRVGYGNAYDEATRRAYEQVREATLRPYRALLSLERLRTLGPGPEGARRRAALLGLVSAGPSLES